MTNITLRAENITIGDKEKKFLFRPRRSLRAAKKIKEKDVVIMNGLLEKLGIYPVRSMIGCPVSFSWTEGDIRKTTESIITGFHFVLLNNQRIEYEQDFSVSVCFKDSKEEKEKCIDYFGSSSRRKPHESINTTKYGLIINSWFFCTFPGCQRVDSPEISFIENPKLDGKYLEFYSGRKDCVVYSQTGPHVIVSEEKNGDIFVTDMCLGRCRYKKTWRKNYMRLTYLDQPLTDWDRSSIERVKVLS